MDFHVLPDHYIDRKHFFLFNQPKYEKIKWAKIRYCFWKWKTTLTIFLLENAVLSKFDIIKEELLIKMVNHFNKFLVRKVLFPTKSQACYKYRMLHVRCEETQEVHDPMAL